MADGRILIVNADDFGLSPGVNRAILRAHTHGIVTSASLMVRPASAADAVARSRDCPTLDLGLHLDLGEWAFEDREWKPLYEVVALSCVETVCEEVRRQLEAFRTLAGGDPTHLDSHQHVHCREPAHSAVLAVARELDVPVRHLTPGIRYCGRFYGQTTEGQPIPGAVTVEALVALLAELPDGTTELACHPGDGNDTLGMYRMERAQEAAVLCDPRVQSALAHEGIKLGSFRELVRGQRSDAAIPHCH